MTVWVASAGVARFVWTRNKIALGACVLVYAGLIAVSQSPIAGELDSWIRGLYPLLRFAPVLLPLIFFVSTASAFTLDLAGTESRYPAHFLTLPLSSRQLVLPFMFGALLLGALLWAGGFIVSDGLLLASPQHLLLRKRPPLSDLEFVPVLIASGIAWVQALTWMSFSRRGRRVWSLVAMVLAHITVVFLVATSSITTLAAVVACAGSIGAAIGVATWGIQRARRGDPLVYDKALAKPRARKPVEPSRPFPSALAAQIAFEWKAHGLRHASPFLWIVPLVIAVSIPLTLAGRWHAQYSPDAHALIGMVVGAGIFVASTLLCVAFVSGPAAASFRARPTWGNSKDDFAMPAFFAALPLPTGDFAWAKMRTVARAMLSLLVVTLVLAVPLT
jgi:hypothetical protein